MKNKNSSESTVQGSFKEAFGDECKDIRLRRQRNDIAGGGENEPIVVPGLELSSPSAELSDIIDSVQDEVANQGWTDQNATEDGVQPGLIGVALSGGGIRSSTFNLGVLQAIEKVGLFRYVDYLSTVSGGGYIGTYVTTSIQEDDDLDEGKEAQGEQEKPISYFPLKHEVGKVESVRFRHLRNYASFLTADDRLEILAVPSILLRGVFSNLMSIAPLFILIAVLLTWAVDDGGKYSWLAEGFASAATVDSLITSISGKESVVAPDALYEFPVTVLALSLLGLYFLAFPALQALVVAAMPSNQSSENWRNFTREALKWFSIILVVVFLVEVQPVLMRLVESVDLSNLQSVSFGSIFLAVTLSAEKYVKAFQGIFAKLGVAIYGVIAFALLWWGMLSLAVEMNSNDPAIGWHFALLMALALFVYTNLFVDINSTSIHKYYRDKLATAFVAQATSIDYEGVQSSYDARTAALGENSYIKSETAPKLSQLTSDRKPYHIINAAINIRTKSKDYRSGRKASSYMFGRRYSGSIRSGYVETEKLEKLAPNLDVGTAMAISGAAAAPNMGKFTNSGLAFVLALLNVRLNYWLPNLNSPMATGTGIWDRVNALANRPGPLYLFREMFGALNDHGRYLNLSDGGHIENLGVYELLRRQCRLIISGDGECDPHLTFEGLSEVIRLAKIDFGFEIEMDGLDEIRSGDKQYAIGRIRYAGGSHGQPERIGYLIYLKSNLGGDYNLRATMADERYRTSPDRDDDSLFDENAYIAHYRDQNPDFPHETTADQFFNESQFESYRALGYQVAASALIKPWTATNQEEVV